MKKSPMLSEHNFIIHAIGIEKMWKHSFVPIGRLFASLLSFIFFAFLFGLCLTDTPADIYMSALCFVGFILEGIQGYRNFSDVMILIQSICKQSIPLTISFRVTCTDKVAAIEHFAARYYLEKSLRRELDSALQKAMANAGFDPKLLNNSVDYHLHLANRTGGVLEICVLSAAK